MVNIGGGQKLPGSVMACVKSNPGSRSTTPESSPASPKNEPIDATTRITEPSAEQKVTRSVGKEKMSKFSFKSPKETKETIVKVSKSNVNPTVYKLMVSEYQVPFGRESRNQTIWDNKDVISTTKPTTKVDGSLKALKRADEATTYRTTKVTENKEIKTGSKETKASPTVTSKSQKQHQSTIYDYEKFDPLKKDNDDSHYIMMKTPAHKDDIVTEDEERKKNKLHKCVKISLIAFAVVILICALATGIYFGVRRSSSKVVEESHRESDKF